MAKAANQKSKLLYLMQYLLDETDENNGVSTAQIIAYLGSLGIPMERKSLYTDLEALRGFGLDIIKLPGKPPQYAVASRDFELAEVKLLVDAVQSSRFITRKKTLELISKLERLCGKHGARRLQGQVFVRNRIKYMNESIFINVDYIHSAISDDKQISFLYFDYSMNKEKTYRKSGERYCVSPYALSWDDEKYYLIAYDQKSSSVRHYRVDKMDSLQIEAESREGKELLGSVDISEYAGKVFGMFSGEEKSVRMKFSDKLVNAIIDRFGSDVIITPYDEESFTITVNIVVSPQFFSWLCGFGDSAELLSPLETRKEYADYIRSILTQYEN